RRAVAERDQRAERLEAEIAGRIAADRARGETEERHRLAVRATNDAIWDWHFATDTVSWNEALQTAYGHAPHDVEPSGDWWIAHIHPDDRARVDASIHAAVDGDAGSWSDEYRFRRADGSYAHVLDRGHIIRDPDGRATRMIGAMLDLTERNRSAAALRDSEERLRLAVDHAEIGFWDVDHVNDILIWPPRTKAMFGISADVPVTMQDFYDGLHPDDREATSAVYAAAADPGRRALYDVDYRTIGKEDGVVRWIAAKGRGVFDDGGRCLRVVGTAVDITRRKQIEAALRDLNDTLEKRVASALAERKLLADIVEGTDAFVQVADPGYRWLAINRAAADEFMSIYGVRPKVGDSMLDLLADRPEQQAAVREVWGRALGGEEFTELGAFGDERLERRCYEMKYNVLRDAQGSQIGAYQFVYDVTQRVTEQRRLAEAEAARRQADVLYRAYFENSAEALFVIGVLPDGDFVIEDLNPRHQAAVGLRLKDVQGRRMDEVVPPELLETARAHYRHVLASGQVSQYRETFEIKGQRSHWDTVLVPVRDGEGRIVRLIGSSRDLTRQQAVEEQLRQAQKMEAVGQLTGGIAHDFNNMLAVVIGSLDLLNRRVGASDARAKRYVDAAADGARRAATLTQRLLAFSRQQPLKPEPVDANKLVAGMSDLLRHSLGGDVRLETVLAGGLWRTNADPNQLENVILNLAINARDAMPEGGRLTIETANCHLDARYVTAHLGVPAGQYVMVAVTDTGSGMPPEVIAKAFDPFFTTKEVGKGTGLGLSQVYGFVKQTGGHVKIYSEPGEGTTIKVYLPRLIGVELVPDEIADAADLPRGEQQEIVLVVEDEPAVRQFSIDALTELGYRVLEADGAAAALRMLDAHPEIALMFTDIVMPEVNGAKLAEEARRRRPDLKVLFTTGYTRNAVVHNGVLDAGVELIGKPFTIEDLAAKVREVLETPLGSGELPPA
ncbi:hybrid sensor histidine kinase/response regulator, partial [Sphingomonas bacterium]|uniref:hybrid sensor histidine kinase/response regulator n=1 Tax=Sphingomonas bacterium TaxID=1895847 RepID=UPI0015755D49